jgi:hypothetical protein
VAENSPHKRVVDGSSPFNTNTILQIIKELLFSVSISQGQKNQDRVKFSRRAESSINAKWIA